MNAAEFTTWYAQHVAAFPSVAKWMADNQHTLKTWQATLADLDLADCIAATQAIQRGEVRAYGVEDHPATIASHARVSRAQRHEGRPKARSWERRYNCGKCLDHGAVLIYSVATMRIARDELSRLQPFDFGPYLDQPELLAAMKRRYGDSEYCLPAGEMDRVVTYNVACSCSEGSKFIDPPKHYRKLPVLDESVMVVCRDPSSLDLTPLVEFWMGYQPPNHDDSFDSWNEGATV